MINRFEKQIEIAKNNYDVIGDILEVDQNNLFLKLGKKCLNQITQLKNI